VISQERIAVNTGRGDGVDRTPLRRCRFPNLIVFLVAAAPSDCVRMENVSVAPPVSLVSDCVFQLL
jgi:hypothetical protein